MQTDGLEARVRRRYRSTAMSDHDQPVAANILDRKFEASAPNERWVGDTTELLTASGKFDYATPAQYERQATESRLMAA